MSTSSSSSSLKLIETIEGNKREESRKIVSKAKRQGVDVLSPVGALRVTVLQFAAWRGWTDLMDALEESGADVNVADKLGRCPLHYAAHQGNVDATQWLVQRGAVLDNRVEINSCTREVYRTDTDETLNVVIGKNLPLPECWGRTALHQAVRNNFPEVVRILVKAGADVNVKDERNVTPLLLAGTKVNSNDSDEMNQFAEVVDILVTAKSSTNLIHPDTGSTALHHAANLGSSSATERLLEGGAWPLFRCLSTGSTALHIAASFGSSDTLAILLKAIDSKSIDIPDEVGRTPLHRAAYQGNRECVELLANYGGNLAAETKTGVTVIEAIFAHVSRPISFMTELLDSGIRPNGNCCTEKGSYVSVDFGVLAPKGQLQMGVITALIGAASNIEQLAILKHPLLESFLSLKWSKLRGFFFILVLVHVFFVLSLSSYAIVLLRRIENFTLPRHVLMICSCLLVIHNTIQVLMVPRYYLRQFETWSSLTCAAISLATSTIGRDCIIETVSSSSDETSPTVAAASATTNTDTPVLASPPSWVFHSISLAILFAWIQMMLLIGRFPTYGYYALMFSTVLKNILKVLLAFICLIVGFALSFSVLFHGNDQFRDSWRALLKTVVMMMGEYEYGDLFYDENLEQNNGNDISLVKKNFLHVTSRIVFLGFIVIASIVLMNLMIGLAVNDVQGLEKEGNIRMLLKQAEFVAHLERVTLHRIFNSKLLHFRLRFLINSRRFITTKLTIGCNEKYPRQSHDISTDLLDALFELAAKNINDNHKSKSIISNKDLNTALINMEQLLRQLQNSQNETYRLSSKFTRSFVKRKTARRIRSTNA